LKGKAARLFAPLPVLSIAPDFAEHRRPFGQAPLAICAFFDGRRGVAHKVDLLVGKRGSATALPGRDRGRRFCRQSDLQ
jgi:hypothetical protein